VTDEVDEDDTDDLSLFARGRRDGERLAARRAKASVVRAFTPAARTDDHLGSVVVS
jgi:hypothetical protein